eukprot:3626483-Rhodomonas_salina.1
MHALYACICIHLSETRGIQLARALPVEQELEGLEFPGATAEFLNITKTQVLPSYPRSGILVEVLFKTVFGVLWPRLAELERVGAWLVWVLTWQGARLQFEALMAARAASTKEQQGGASAEQGEEGKEGEEEPVRLEGRERGEGEEGGKRGEGGKGWREAWLSVVGGVCRHMRD